MKENTSETPKPSSLPEPPPQVEVPRMDPNKKKSRIKRYYRRFRELLPILQAVSLVANFLL